MYGSFKQFKKDLHEIKESRTILYSMVRKDLFGRYKNSALGFGWHFVMPTMMLLVYYVVFTAGIRVVSMDDFIVFLASGLFLFNFMVSNLSGGAGCVTNNAGMVKKMYFPREILVIAHVTSSFIIMLLGYLIVFALIIVTGFSLNKITLLLIPVLLALSYIFVLGYVFLFSALNVYAHDVQYFLSSISMVFMFLTPIYFSVNDISGILSTIVWFNPYTYYIETIHLCVYYGSLPGILMILACFLIAIVSLLIGTLTFRRLKHGFAERL